MARSLMQDIAKWFNLAVPERTHDNLKVQIGCHFEEVGEMLSELNKVSFIDNDVYCVSVALKEGAQPNFNLTKLNRVAIADALADQIVTAIGVAEFLGIDLEGALKEVNRSNWSKFSEDGLPEFDKNGKIAKSSNYEPPSLERFVGKVKIK